MMQSVRSRAGINLNPYQGLKPGTNSTVARKTIGRNQPKSLSGIETGKNPQYVI